MSLTKTNTATNCQLERGQTITENVTTTENAIMIEIVIMIVRTITIVLVIMIAPLETRTMIVRGTTTAVAIKSMLDPRSMSAVVTRITAENEAMIRTTTEAGTKTTTAIGITAENENTTKTMSAVVSMTAIVLMLATSKTATPSRLGPTTANTNATTKEITLASGTTIAVQNTIVTASTSEAARLMIVRMTGTTEPRAIMIAVVGEIIAATALVLLDRWLRPAPKSESATAEIAMTVTAEAPAEVAVAIAIILNRAQKPRATARAAPAARAIVGLKVEPKNEVTAIIHPQAAVTMAAATGSSRKMPAGKLGVTVRLSPRFNAHGCLRGVCDPTVPIAAGCPC